MAEDEGKGVALVILGIVAIVAIIGLVMLFSAGKRASTGSLFVEPAGKFVAAVCRDNLNNYLNSCSGSATHCVQLGTCSLDGCSAPCSNEAPGCAVCSDFTNPNDCETQTLGGTSSQACNWFEIQQGPFTTVPPTRRV